MNTLEIISQVRFKVGDVNISPPVFSDANYTTEIEAICGSKGFNIENLSSEESYLVVLLVSSQMCIARASMQLSSQSLPTISEGDIKELGFDDIEAKLYDMLKPVDFWLKMSAKYEAEAKDLIKILGIGQVQINNENMVRIDDLNIFTLSTGSYYLLVSGNYYYMDGYIEDYYTF